MLPFFSIITPVYNCRRFIKKCIDSVIKQTYPSWELILIDDGSTDSSSEICDSYCYDARIKVIHQENSGQLVSRLNGVAIAEGVYTLGLDADDYLDIDCLEKIKRAIDISGSDAVFFGYRNVGYQRGYVGFGLEAGKEYGRKEILKEIIERTNHSLWNKAIRIDKFRKAEYSGIKKRLDINEDYVQIVSVLCHVDTVYVMGDILYNYRIYEKSISHRYNVKHIWDTNIATEYILRQLKKSSLLDAEIYNAAMLAYLKMIGPRIFELIREKEISVKDCRNIHKSKIYKQSKKMESLDNLNKQFFLILKLFRFRQYWFLKLYAELKK